MDAKLLTHKQVAAIIGLSVSSVWRLSRHGIIPKPVHITDGITRWKAADVYEWIEQLEYK